MEGMVWRKEVTTREELGQEPEDQPKFGPSKTENRATTDPKKYYNFCYLMKIS